MGVACNENGGVYAVTDDGTPTQIDRIGDDYPNAFLRVSDVERYVCGRIANLHPLKEYPFH